MRRIAISLTVLALVAGALGCSSDAPTPPKSGGPGGPGPTGPSALQIRLFTSNPNPSAGTCTLIQAIVTLNGANVPDGTGVAFTTDFGVFAQNGLPLISVVTQNGAALTALCSEFPGTAVVRASATVGTETGSATISIAFQQAPAGAGPFISFCDPSFGPSTGGTPLALRGGRFCPTSGCTGNEAAGTRVVFIVNGVSREATVTSVSNDAINVLTPGFPEVTSPSTPVEIRVTLNNGTATPTVLSLPNCFAFGTTLPTTPTITAVLPASGMNEGNTRVTIIGSGFDSQGGVQVFFGGVEATIVSVSFNQIVVLTPAAFGSGRDNLNQIVDVRVRNIASGLESTLEGGYRYTQPIQLISISPTEERLDQTLTPVTIFGHGFQGPVAVTLAGRPAVIISVSESELVVLPTRPLSGQCSNVSGSVVVTNINTGDSASGLSFTYLGVQPTISFLLPNSGVPGTSVTITGADLPTRPEDTRVFFGNVEASVTSASENEVVSPAPTQPTLASPQCLPGNPVGTPQPATGGLLQVRVTNVLTQCSATSPFQYELPCVPATPTPTVSASPTTTPSPTPTPTPTPGMPADLAITISDSPDPVTSGGQLTYTIEVTNNGPGSAGNVTMTDPLPAGTTFVLCTTGQGTCSGPSVGTNGTVTANIGQLAPTAGGNVTITIVVNVTGAAPPSLSNTVTVTSGPPSSTPDPNGADNFDTEITTVNP
ncbi:MAG TPA: IPT/TIG domain-containing protein [Thermoanaerobaculia bacterium]|nr:IPT/TIG domain-containing protein [Thermoanaerobaculia bacterium]